MCGAACNARRDSAFYATPAAVPITHCIRIFSAVICALVLTLNLRAADAKTRVALVIGNSRYEAAVGPLRNTVNDAHAMAKTLRALGFTVIEETNVTRDELLAAMLKFRTKLRGAEVGLFYFAGHGISVAGANYLIPIRSGYKPDAADDTARRLLAETKLFNAEQAVAEMSNTGVACNLVILDACRSTPVARNPALRDATKSGGLVEMNPPAGSLIAFSTDAGRAASDGDGANGIYTAELITHLRTPGLTIEQVFKRTRAGVMERSGGAQIPAEYSRLVGDDIFLAGPAPAAKPEEEPIPKGQPVRIPTLAEINKLAVSGDAARCVEALRRYVRKNGAPTAPTAPLTTLLDQVKENLRAGVVAGPAHSFDASGQQVGDGCGGRVLGAGDIGNESCCSAPRGPSGRTALRRVLRRRTSGLRGPARCAGSLRHAFGVVGRQRVDRRPRPTIVLRGA